MNSVYGSTLIPYLKLNLRDECINRPVGQSYHIEHLLEFIYMKAQDVGLKDFSLAATPRDAAKTKVVRAITDAGPSFPPLTVAQVVETLEGFSNDEIALVYQVSQEQQKAGRRCDICSDPNHLVASCPYLLKLKDDPIARKRTMGVLRSMNGIPSRPSYLRFHSQGRGSDNSSQATASTRLSANLTSSIQQLEQSRGDEDTNETDLGGVALDSLADTDEEPGFP